MKKLLLYLFCLTTYIAKSQPSLFSFTPGPNSGSFVGTITINENPAEELDWIAAFDEDGNCCGAAQLIEDSGISYCSFPIYADDALTPASDEGINGTEKFTLQLFDSSNNEYLGHPSLSNLYEFGGWENMMGAPMSSYNDFTTIYNFSSSSANINNDFTRDILIYPNPATDYIAFRDNKKISELKIFNSRGHLIFYTPTYKSSINTSHFAEGNYFLSFKTDNSYYSTILTILR